METVVTLKKGQGRFLKDIMSEDGIRIRGVYGRSDGSERIKEGLGEYKGFIGEEFDTRVKISENGVDYIVDVENGQKTGFWSLRKLLSQVLYFSGGNRKIK